MKKSGPLALSATLLGAVLLIIGLLGAPGIGIYSLASTPTIGTSINPRVSCSPTIVNVGAITQNQTATSAVPYGPYAPGITTTVTGGSAKRWLTPSTITPSGWRSPGPACSITNTAGQSISSFVELDNVFRVSGSAALEDCSTSYDPVNGGTLNGGVCGGGSGVNCGTYCDTTFLIGQTSGLSCSLITDPGCKIMIHAEIDHDWKAAHYCGTGTVCDNTTLVQTTTPTTALDIQGFVSWDPDHTINSWHAFNGWEIHPITAWRLHQTPPTFGVAFSTSPTPGVAGSPITFSASVVGGTAPYTYNWIWGDGSSQIATTGATSHSYTTPGVYTVSVTVVDSSAAKLTASAIGSVTVIPATPGIAASFTWSPLTPQVGATITFTATVSGGLSPYTINWQFGDGTTGSGSITSHSFGNAGSFAVTLSATDTSTPVKTGLTTQNVAVSAPPPNQLTASMTYSPTIAITGQPIVFTATVSGGIPAYIYSWHWSDGSADSAGGTLAHTFTTAGSYPVVLTVTDSSGAAATAASTVIVQNPTSSGGPGGGSLNLTLTIPPTWAIFSSVGLALVLVGVAMAYRGRVKVKFT